MSQAGEILLNIVSVFLKAYWYMLLAYVLLSWILNPMSTVMQFLRFLTEPILNPIRKLLAPLTEKSSIPLDLSPLIAVIIISMLQSAVVMLTLYLY